MKHAGCEREHFSTDAVAMIHEAALGRHRDLDRVATDALREAAKNRRKLVERDTFARVLDHERRDQVD